MLTIKFYENNNNFVVLNQYGDENGETVYVIQLETHVHRTATTSDRKKALAAFQNFKKHADRAAAEQRRTRA